MPKHQIEFLRIKNVVTETKITIKPSMGGFNSRLNTIEKSISELEESFEEAQRDEMMEKHEKEVRRHRQLNRNIQHMFNRVSRKSMERMR